MNLQPSHLVFAVGTVIYLSTRAVFQRRAARNQKALRQGDLRDRSMILLVFCCQLGLPALLMSTSWLDAANCALPAAVTWAGTVVMAFALWLFWRSHADLGNSWSITLELNQNHRLVTHGLYRRIRHPMYASFFAMALAQAMLLHNVLAGWSSLVAVTLFYWVRMPGEERMMQASFGDAYRNYMQRTGRVLPRLLSSTPKA